MSRRLSWLPSGGLVNLGFGISIGRCRHRPIMSKPIIGFDGLNTIDNLARVKRTIVRTLRPDGWAVLNADYDYVEAMRESTPATRATEQGHQEHVLQGT